MSKVSLDSIQKLRTITGLGMLDCKKALEEAGESVMLYDVWNPQIRQADVVHYFSVFGGSAVFCNYVKSLGKPLAISSILFPHRPEDYGMDEIRFILNTADIILPNSISEAELLSRVCGIHLDRFHPVYNGIDEAFLKDPTFDENLFRKKFKVDGKYLLCVGNIERRKNQIALARALKNTDHELILLGNIRSQEYFDEMMTESNGKIRHLGHLPHDSDLLRSAYLGCETFVLPSLLETPGLAAMEAAAMGAKIVVTEVGSTREYFENFATYVDPLSERSILDGIQNSLSQGKNSELKNHVRRKFPWSETAKQTLAAYSKIFG